MSEKETPEFPKIIKTTPQILGNIRRMEINARTNKTKYDSFSQQFFALKIELDKVENDAKAAFDSYRVIKTKMNETLISMASMSGYEGEQFTVTMDLTNGNLIIEKKV